MERIHGAVQVTWTEGAGTAFTLESPPSLATMQAVLVTLGSGIFAIASAHVEGLLRVRPEEIRQAEGQDVVLSLRSPCPIVHLASLLGSPPPRDPPSGHLHAVHLRVGARELAVVVDELVAVEEIIIRPVERLPNPPGYLGGASLLRNGRIALVLNAAVLISAGLKGGLPALLPRSDALATSVRRRILVVDDSLTTRALEQSILQAEGFDVLTANDGEEGWRLLQDQSVDLVVSDVDMPRMDGFELCKAIRASRQFADLPIILVTAKEEAEHRELGMEAGADAYLPKSSFDQQSLLDTIQQLLG